MGPFVSCIRTSLSNISDDLGLLYADFPLVEPDEFADFHVAFNRSAGLRHWFRPQVRFDADGITPFAPLPLNHAYPLFESAMNWCVSSRAHSYLMIHAAVVERDGFAAILPGVSGSGKSTLCAALVSKGWRLLSDELTLLRLEDGHIVPLPRPISLKNESIDLIGKYATNAVWSQTVNDTAKGKIAYLKPPTHSVLQANLPARPAWVVFPTYCSGAEANLEPVARARGFMDIADNAFNYDLLGMDGFNALSSLVSHVQCFNLTYSSLDDAIEIFSGLDPTYL